MVQKAWPINQVMDGGRTRATLVVKTCQTWIDELGSAVRATCDMTSCLVLYCTPRICSSKYADDDAHGPHGSNFQCPAFVGQDFGPDKKHPLHDAHGPWSMERAMHSVCKIDCAFLSYERVLCAWWCALSVFYWQYILVCIKKIQLERSNLKRIVYDCMWCTQSYTDRQTYIDKYYCFT